MRLTTILLIFVFAFFVVPAKAGCPTTATCPEHGAAGNPTGQYMWQGSTEYAQFSHALYPSGTHVWWERCN
jgi:hypothetical protein